MGFKDSILKHFFSGEISKIKDEYNEIMRDYENSSGEIIKTHEATIEALRKEVASVKSTSTSNVQLYMSANKQKIFLSEKLDSVTNKYHIAKNDIIAHTTKIRELEALVSECEGKLKRVEGVLETQKVVIDSLSNQLAIATTTPSTIQTSDLSDSEVENMFIVKLNEELSKVVSVDNEDEDDDVEEGDSLNKKAKEVLDDMDDILYNMESHLGDTRNILNTINNIDDEYTKQGKHMNYLINKQYGDKYLFSKNGDNPPIFSFGNVLI